MNKPEKIVLFRLANRLYALPNDEGSVTAVVTARNITPVPRVAERLAGAFYFRGRIIPVLDGHALFGTGLSRKDNEAAVIIVLSRPDGFTGLSVDRAEDAADTKSLSAPLTPVVVRGEVSTAVRAAGTFRDETFFLLDTETLLKNDRPFNPRIEDRILKTREGTAS